MQFNKFSLITLLALISVSFVNAQVDDNVVPRPGDDRLPAPGVPPPTGTVDDSGHTGTDDHSHNSTTTRVPTSTSVPVNGAMNNGVGALGLASVFAFFMF